MCPTLVRVRWSGFSKTARSRPGHGKAGRHGSDGRALAIVGWRLADDVAKRARECAQAVEADVQADVRHAAVGLAQQVHRALDTTALEVAVRRLAEGRPKGTDEMRLRHTRDAREGRHVEGLGIRAVHRVPGTKKSSV